MEASCTVSRDVNGCSHYEKQYGGFSKKLKTELSYDPAIPILGIYPKKMKTLIQKDICILLCSLEHYSQYPRYGNNLCPLVDEWIENMRYANTTTEDYSAIKENETLPLVITWIDMQGIMLDEIIETEKDRYHMISLIRGI